MYWKKKEAAEVEEEYPVATERDDKQRLLDYQTLGRFIGIAQMLTDKSTTTEYALDRIVSIYATYEERKKEIENG